MSGIKIAGTWIQPALLQVKVSGTWRTVSQTFVKVDGTWRTTTLGSAPSAPIMDHHTATGQFIITNYNASLVYTATNISGGGTATLNTTTGVYTVSSATSRWSVSAAYAVGAPQSAVDYMERKAYTYSYVQTGCSPNCRGICCGCGPTVNCSNCCPQLGGCGCCGDGSCGADGCICCGGSAGCTPTYGNVKDATPSGYNDSYSEWWKVT